MFRGQSLPSLYGLERLKQVPPVSAAAILLGWAGSWRRVDLVSGLGLRAIEFEVF